MHCAEVSRLITIYDLALSENGEALQKGRTWYGDARFVAAGLAHTYGVSVSTAAGVIAALSPRKTWSQNVKLAARCLKGETIATVGQFRAMAEQIRDGAHPLWVLQGRKIRAFYYAILYGGDLRYRPEDAVVVDVWMMRAMGMGDRSRLTPLQYERAVEQIMVAADACGVAPAVFQAVVWCQQRGASN